MPRYFTVDQARRYLTKVNEDLRRAILLKQEYDKAGEELSGMTNRVMMMGGVRLDRERFLAQRARRDATAMRLKETVEEIHALGCQVKDLESGLIDFPTLYHGGEVLLCWKVGESDIAHWHGLEEGFRGRRPIDQEFLDNHKGEAGV